MKEGWEELDFESCLKKINKVTKIPKKIFLTEGKYPIISQEDEFINGFWNKQSDVFKIKKPVVIFGDHTKKLKYVDFDFVLGADGVKVLLPLDNISSKYFFYHLQALKLDDLGYARHYRLLRSKMISIAPLSEQKEIVAILDEAFAAIDTAKANIEKNIENVNELFQSRLNDIFSRKEEGWEVKKLGDVCIVERGSSPRPINKYITDNEDGVNWIKIGDVNENDKYVWKTDQKITKEGAKKSRFVNVGDFILSNSMSFGRPYIMKIPGYIHDGWFVLRLPSELNPDYFWQLLASPYLKKQFEELAAGAIVKNISSVLVKKAIIPLPPFNVQDEIVKETENLHSILNNLQKHYQQKLSNLEDLKQSLLQKAFAGELT